MELTPKFMLDWIFSSTLEARLALTQTEYLDAEFVPFLIVHPTQNAAL